MAFQNDIYTVMSTDSSLNTAMNNNIFFENLEENYDLTKDHIVYTFRKLEQKDCLQTKNAYTTYSVYVRILTQDTIKLNSLSDYIQTYLNGKTYSGIQDMWFINDTHTLDLDRNQYSILLEFGAFYL